MIIQTIDKTGHVISTQRYVGSRVDIGRAYCNQHIVTDPYVDGKHVRIEYDPQHDVFFVSDFDTANGTSIVRKKQRIEATSHPTPLQAGDTLLIGKTYLRVVNEHTPVPLPLRFSRFEDTYTLLGQWWVFVVAAAGVLLLNALSIYVEQPFSETLTKQYAEGVYIALVALAVAAGWSVVAKLQHLDVRFLLYSNLVLISECVFILVDLIEWVIKFNAPWMWLGGYFPEFIFTIGLFVVMYICGYHATRLRLKGRLILAAIVPALIVLTSLMKLLDKDDFRSRPDYKMIVVSPSWQWRGSASEQRFLEAAKKNYIPAKKEENK